MQSSFTKIATSKFIIFIASLVSVGGILYGYDIGVISGALLFVQNDIPLTQGEIGRIVAAVLGGSIIGTLLAGPIADHYGRRSLLFSAGGTFLLGLCAILLAHGFMTLCIARVLLGVGVGFVSVAVPLYVSEMVPPRHRGKFVTLFQLLLVTGIMLAYLVDLAFTPSGNWRGMFAVLFIPSLILFFGTFFLPETPRWLLSRQRTVAARAVLDKIYPGAPFAVEQEYQHIMLGLKQLQHVSWRKLLSRQLLLPTFIAIIIAICNQLTGINLFLQYAPLILKNAGIHSNVISVAGSLGLGALNLLFTLIAIALIDKVGRRPLLLIGVAGVVISEIFLGCVNEFMPASPLMGMLSLYGLLSFIAFFAIGPGVVVWLAISELFPTAMRGKGIALSLFFSSLSGTLLSGYFLQLVQHLGMGKSYWLFATFGILYFLVGYFFLPETRARSLEDIQSGFLVKTACGE